jgi:hypothetical protein
MHGMHEVKRSGRPLPDLRVGVPVTPEKKVIDCHSPQIYRARYLLVTGWWQEKCGGGLQEARRQKSGEAWCRMYIRRNYYKSYIYHLRFLKWMMGLSFII